MSDKPLFEALYRARATLAEVSHLCSEWSGAARSSGVLMGLQQIDSISQSGVEDADAVLLDHEQVNMVDMLYCSSCHGFEMPDPEETDPWCCFQPMEKVKMERIN